MDWEEHERLWYALKGVDNAMQDGSLHEQVDALSWALNVALNILPPYQPQPGDLYRALGLPVPDGAEPPLAGRAHRMIGSTQHHDATTEGQAP